MTETVDVRPPERRVELTVRAVLLGILITVIFTAANVFFGLKAGLTFASSIPATVISMAFLRLFKSSTIQENNIVQTVASAAGTLSSIIFILPGLVIVGWWTGFPFWMSFGVCALGGTLGVMYSIPLRRALVTDSDLPYPEGVACAEVLKVGSAGADPDASADEQAGGAAETRAGLFAVIWGAVASASFALVVATRLFAGNVAKTLALPAGPLSGGGTGYNLGLSMALLGVGHLVGLWVGVAMLVGVAIAWLGAVPHLTAHHVQIGDVAAFVTRYHVKPGFDAYVASVFKNEVRLVGAGVIGVAAIWTLLKLILPIVTGLRAALASQRARVTGQGASLAITERDIPIGLVGLIGLVCLAPIAWMLVIFAQQASIGALTWPLAVGGVIFIAIMGFLVAAVCGYMAGLIGSSNSPLSGVGILATVAASGLIVLGVRATGGSMSGMAGKALIAFTLFLVSFVFNVASIANDNLQDLKTGQLVEATPWKQQVALIIGVLVGASVIPPILNQLAAFPGFGDEANALAAPQARLMSFLAQGVITGDLNWGLVGIGAAIGLALIVLDEVLRVTKLPRLAPLAVGLGVYLPQDVTLMIVVGAILGHLFDRYMDRKPYGESGKRLGVLMSSGLIVGESLVGVALAFLAGALIKGGPLAPFIHVDDPTSPLALVGDAFAQNGVWLGVGAFVLITAALYVYVAGQARRAGRVLG